MYYNTQNNKKIFIIKSKPILLVLTLLFSLINAKVVLAQINNKITSDNISAKEKGLNIVKEADQRLLGFESFEVNIKMILKNAYNQSTKRLVRNKTLEVKDQNIGDKSMIIFDSPADIKGTAFLTFSKVLEADDQWMYLPSIKRVKRISSKNKSGPFMGSEFAFEDISSQEVSKYSYKYLKSQSCELEEVKDLQCFVVEYKPLYQYSGYSKKIVFIDHKEFRIYKIDFYDRKGDLLKTQINKDYKKYLNKYWYASYSIVNNIQTNRSTELFWSNYRFKIGLKESDFNKSKLKQIR